MRQVRLRMPCPPEDYVTGAVACRRKSGRWFKCMRRFSGRSVPRDGSPFLRKGASFGTAGPERTPTWPETIRPGRPHAVQALQRQEKGTPEQMGSALPRLWKSSISQPPTICAPRANGGPPDRIGHDPFGPCPVRDLPIRSGNRPQLARVGKRGRSGRPGKP